MNSKKIVVFRDMDDNNHVMSTIIVDEGVSIKDIERSIQKTKNSLPGGWMLDDIMNNLNIEYESLDDESVYL